MEFKFSNWNVDLIQEPNALMKKIKSFKLKGRKIKSIRIVGLCYGLIDSLEEEIYIKTNSQEESDIQNFKDEYEFNRIIEIDEPIIIEFEDGDRFEIDFSEGSTLKIGLNSLPYDIEPGININNLDGNVIFSNCIGQKIIGTQVDVQDEFELTYEFTGSSGSELPSDRQEYFISAFRIYLDNQLSICFKSWYDYGHVYIEKFAKIEKITWNELKNGISRFD